MQQSTVAKPQPLAWVMILHLHGCKEGKRAETHTPDRKASLMNVLVGELVLQLDSALNACFFLFFVVVVFHLNKGWSTQTRTFHPITAVTHRFVAVSSGDIVWSTVWSLMDGNISTAQSLKKTSKGTKFVQIAFWLLWHQTTSTETYVFSNGVCAQCWLHRLDFSQMIKIQKSHVNWKIHQREQPHGSDW